MARLHSRESIMDLLKSEYIHGFLKKYWIPYLIGAICLITIDYLQTVVPIIVGSIIDGLGTSMITPEQILTKIGSIVLIVLVVIVGRVGWRFAINGTSRKIERDIRNDLFAHLEKMSPVYYNEHKTGEVMAYITNDLEAVRNSVGQGMMMLFDTIFMGSFTLFNMVKEVDATLTIVGVIPLLFISLTTFYIGPKLFQRFADRQAAFADMSDFVQESLSGVKVVKAFVQEDKELHSFEEIGNNYLKTNINLMKIQAASGPLMRSISGLAMGLAIAYGGYIAVQGVISVGDFSIFVQYLGMLVWPMMAVGMTINIIAMGSAALKRIEYVLGEPIAIKDEADTKPLTSLEGSIQIKDLTYQYPGTDVPVLEHISFSIQKGDTLGIVGRTGSGKTTLVNLLLRMYNVEKDKIIIGGTDIMQIPLHTLRKNIGYVPQDNFLFSDTIEGNIDFREETYGMDRVVEAAEFACVHDNIVDFKEGYGTIVGERGVTLSGGQKQRVSIARALINDPEILIMDDSVSAVDTATEEQILNNLKSKRAGKTNIIIAHRISTIQNANHIIVLDDGRIVEQGTHEELVTHKGLYNSLYEKQLLEKIIDEEK